MIDELNQELARVRAAIEALHQEEFDILTALRIVGRLGAPSPPAPLEEIVEPQLSEVEPEPIGGVPPPEPIACVETPTARGFKLGEGEPSEPLLADLKSEAARRGMTIQAVSIAIWNNKARVYQLTNCPTVRKATADRVRAWLAEKPSATVEALPEREPVVDLPPSRDPGPAPIVIPAGRKARPYCRQPDSCAAPARGSCRICQPGSFAKQRRGRPSTAAPQRPAPPPAPPPAPRTEHSDATQKPVTPLTDVADRQRLNGQRYQANIRRGQEREATERLDAGKPPRNSFERSTMAAIGQRREAEHRQTDPVEQAKLALQRKGRVVHSAMIHGGRKDRFMVGGQRDPRTGRLKELTPAELIALAEKVTGQTFRRSAA